MPETKADKTTPPKPGGPPAHRKPATQHGMEEYEEVFRRTDNPYRNINPHWSDGDDKSKSQR